MEAQVSMTTQMIEVCKEKTISKVHKSAELTQDEKAKFQNCILKYFETPNYIMSAMGQMSGEQPGQF